MGSDKTLTIAYVEEVLCNAGGFFFFGGQKRLCLCFVLDNATF